MSGALSEVLAQLRELIGVVDEAAVLALRAQTDAQEAQSAYREAGTGSNRPEIRKAEADARTAGEKAGKTARLLAEAANAFTDYVNIIAPGTVPARYSAPEAAPRGESLATEAANLGSDFERFLGGMGVDADDKHEAIATTSTNIGNGVRIAFRRIDGIHGPHGTVTTPPQHRPDQPELAPGSEVGEFLSAVLFSALAIAVAGKGVKNRLQRRHDKERSGDDQK